MRYAALVDTYESLDATEATVELVDIVSRALASADEEHLPLIVKLIRGDPFAAWRSAELGLSSNRTRAAVAKATGVDESTIEDRWRETGDLGSAAAWAVEHARQQTLGGSQLTVRDVHDTLHDIASYAGEGSQGRRIDAVAGLIADADPAEATYIVRTILGHLRLGVGDGTMRDAIAQAYLADRDDPAFDAAVSAVERGFQVTNDYGLVAATARDAGVDGLDALDVELFRPLRVMLAQKAEGLAAGLAEVAGDRPPLLEYKLDGFRIQIHTDGEDVTVFTRRLEDVTRQFPEIVEWVRAALSAETCIVEGEVVAEDPDTGETLPFQELSRRIKRKHDVATLRESVPVRVHLFDLLYRDGDSYLDRSLEDRLTALDAVLEDRPGEFQRTTNRRTADLETARTFYEDALSAGHEGVMLKNLGASYQPGRRVGYMVKVKPTMAPLDLTIIGAEWSEGRRRNQLGRLILGCRDPTTGEYLDVGRLSTGFTDAELAKITERLEPTIVDQTGRDVDLEPAEVIEVKYEEIQRSPAYASGYALRFPRFVGFRDDLGLEDVDTIETVVDRFEEQ